jgi:hypothetical protein
MRRWVCLFLFLTALLAVPQAVQAAEPAGTEPTGDVLTGALGTLAVYAAVIAAMAAGVEVLTDLLRPLLGLERQPQAMEALEQMQEWLPATLKEMGVDPQAQAQLESVLSQLDKTVHEVQGLADPARIAQEVQKWALGAIKNVGAAGEEWLEAKEQELGAVLKDQLGLNAQQAQQVLVVAKGILNTLQSGEQLKQKVQELKTLVESLNLTAEQIDQVMAQTFEAMSTVAGDQELQERLKKLIKGLGVQEAEVDKFVTQALQVFARLKGVQVSPALVKLAASLDSFSNLLGEVELQREDVISAFRRWWRALRDWDGFGLSRLIFPEEQEWDRIGTEWLRNLLRRLLPDDGRWQEVRQRSLLGALMYYLEKVWNWLWGKGQGGAPPTIILTPESAAQVLLDRDRQEKLQELARQRRLRFVTVFIGMGLAVWLRVDSLQLLKPILGDNLPATLYANDAFLTLEQIHNNLWGVTDWHVDQWTGVGKWLFFWLAVATPGMLLSGLAASAGSSFWHDQLDRLRMAKKLTEQVSGAVGQLQGTEGQG